MTKSVTLDVTLEGVVKDPYGNHRVGFSGSTTINREDFDVSFGAVMEAGGLVVAKKVDIEIELEAVLQSLSSAPPGSARSRHRPLPERGGQCRVRAVDLVARGRMGPWLNLTTRRTTLQVRDRPTGTFTVKRGLAEMLRGGVIMDVVDAEQAKVAEDAGAVAVMALERVPGRHPA